MECEPLPSADVLKEAEPAESGAVPRTVGPSRKVTVPVGVPEPDVGVTVVVKVTDWPAVDGLGVALRDVEVAVSAGASPRMTLTGLLEALTVPFPSLPSTLLPKHCTPPVDMTAHVWPSPAARVTTPLPQPGTVVGLTVWGSPT